MRGRQAVSRCKERPNFGVAQDWAAALNARALADSQTFTFCLDLAQHCVNPDDKHEWKQTTTLCTLPNETEGQTKEPMC